MIDMGTNPAAAESLARSLGSVLDEAELFVRRYVVINEAQATAIVLWIAHTHAIEAARATPYLFVSSAEPESGKTRLLEVAAELVRAPLSTMNISDAALFRAIDTKSPTLLFDEVDSIFSSRARERGHRDELRALLNAGYRRGQEVMRMGGGNNTTLQSFAVFGAKALAGLGDLPATLQSRCLRIELKRRRLRDEPVEDFFPDDVAQEAERLRVAFSDWATLHLDALRAARPARVDGLRDRTNEVWRPLLAIAELAGGPWAARARRAALGLTPQADDNDSLGVLLLGDIRNVFDQAGVERIATCDLIVALGGFDESPWGEWWLDPKTDTPTNAAARRLAQLLRPFGIQSGTVRFDASRTSKGYKREDFIDAWERFLAASPISGTSVTSVTPQAPSEADVTDVTAVTHGRGPSPVTNGVTWLARDGVWRCFDTDPPTLAHEVVSIRGRTTT